MSSSSIPHDLTPDILLDLPVKDLLRFRCVSRLWRALIDSPNFTKSHLTRSQETRSNRFLLNNLTDKIKLLDFDSLQKPPEICQPPIPTEIVGACNGIVVLFTHGEDLSLWNPLTGKLRELPSPKITAKKPGVRAVVHGFGYDSETDDYKLVQIVHFRILGSYSIFSKGEVFSLKTNTWREIKWKIKGSIPNRELLTITALVNNALHWAWSSRILGFDLGKEEFYEVPHPHPGYHMRVGVLEDCLSMAFDYYSCGFQLSVWVMKEYRVKNSWCELFILGFHELGNYSYPITCSTDGKRVLLNIIGRLIWYDLARKTVDNIHLLDDDKYLHKPTLCMGSLVSID